MNFSLKQLDRITLILICITILWISGLFVHLHQDYNTIRQNQTNIISNQNVMMSNQNIHFQNIKK